MCPAASKSSRQTTCQNCKKAKVRALVEVCTNSNIARLQCTLMCSLLQHPSSTPVSSPRSPSCISLFPHVPPTISPPPPHTVALRNLNTRQQSLQLQAKEVAARLAAEQVQVTELQHALGALQEQEHSLPQRVEQLSRVLETKEANIATREKGRGVWWCMGVCEKDMGVWWFVSGSV